MPRTFHPFPHLPSEIRLKIWGIRFADSTRIVDFVVTGSDDEDNTLHLTHDAKLPFRACKEERNESLRLFELGEDIRSKFKPFEMSQRLPAAPDATKELFDNYQFVPCRDIARFQEIRDISWIGPLHSRTGDTMWEALEHICLDEIFARVRVFPHNFSEDTIFPLRWILGRLQCFPALKTVTVLRLCRKREETRYDYGGDPRLGDVQAMSTDEIENCINSLKQRCLKISEFRTVPLIKVLSYSKDPINTDEASSSSGNP